MDPSHVLDLLDNETASDTVITAIVAALANAHPDCLVLDTWFFELPTGCWSQPGLTLSLEAYRKVWSMERPRRSSEPSGLDPGSNSAW